MIDAQPTPKKSTVPCSSLEEDSLRLLNATAETQRTQDALNVRIAEAPTEDGLEETVQAQLDALRRASSNTAKAYSAIFRMRDELDGRWTDARKRRKRIPTPPSNAIIDLEEENSRHFARGLNLYKLLLICYVGSFAGVVVESLWCLVRHGYLESRAGLVYGPFNLLYGAGAVLMTLALYRYRNRSRPASFLGGMIVGSLLEYICSWAQELIFGSRSWDYSSVPFNLNGRICLLYSIFWGILGILWMKGIYPYMAQIILKIPNRIGKRITWALTAFFLFNIFMTCAAMFRWTQRLDGISASGTFSAFFDRHFPNSRMEWIFANMKFQS